MKRDVNKIDMQKLKDALIKKAVGYDTDEIIEEYVVDEKNNSHLIKKKVTKKFVPADLTASKMLLDYYNSAKTNSYENMSEPELDAQVIKLFKEYQQMSNTDILSEIKGEQN